MGKRGRPSAYTQALADEICERLSAGESLRAICRSDRMPTERTVRQWAMEDREGFFPQYTQARDLGLDALADQVLEIADDASIEAADKRVRFDARRWYLSKLAPKRYGDKVQTEVTGANGGPVEQVIRWANDQAEATHDPSRS